MAKTKNRRPTLRVRVEFVGEAAGAIRALHARGLHGATLQLVVESLALSELRRVITGAEPPEASTKTPRRITPRRDRPSRLYRNRRDAPDE